MRGGRPSQGGRKAAANDRGMGMIGIFGVIKGTTTTASVAGVIRPRDAAARLVAELEADNRTLLHATGELRHDAGQDLPDVLDSL